MNPKNSHDYDPMQNRDQLLQAIRQQLIRIVASLGEDASDIGDDELIPATGLIDSAGILELVAWYEQHCGFDLQPHEVTIDNLGSIASMADYALSRKTG
jgi:acyl carrier protein